MKRIETQRSSAARVGRMNRTTRNSVGLSQVAAPNERGDWTEIQDKFPMKKSPAGI